MSGYLAGEVVEEEFRPSSAVATLLLSAPLVNLCTVGTSNMRGHGHLASSVSTFKFSVLHGLRIGACIIFLINVKALAEIFKLLRKKIHNLLE